LIWQPVRAPYSCVLMSSWCNAATVRSNASAGSFGKGQELVASGLVLAANEEFGGGVVGTVQGSGDTPYRIKITQDGANCSCPDKRGGWCKHSVAVMLTVLNAKGGGVTTAAATASTSKRAPANKATPARAARAPRKTTTRGRKKKNWNEDAYEEDEEEDYYYEEEDSEEEEEEEGYFEEEDSEEEEDVVVSARKTRSMNTKSKTTATATKIITPMAVDNKKEAPSPVLFSAAMPVHHLVPKKAAVSEVVPPPIGGVLGPTPPLATPIALTSLDFSAPKFPQLPFHPRQGHGGGCGDCGAWNQNSQCMRCSFRLCKDCLEFGRSWHHLAVAGSEHVFHNA
jgi:hypothetical protein